MRDEHNLSNANSTGARPAIHETAVHFRAKASLVDAAKKLAADRGMSLAELMRHAMRRELDVTGLGAVRDTDKLSEMDTSVRRAACGDVHAQRQEVLKALIGAGRNPHSWHEGVRLAEHWARMAALTGGSEDHARLLSVLGLRIDDCKARGDLPMANQLEMEAIAMVSVFADEGGEGAEACAEALSAYSQVFAPEIMEGAKAFVASWKAAV